MKIAICLVALAVASAGCTDDPESYEDVEAVVEAMEDEGIECEDLETTTEFGTEADSLVTERGLCLVGDNRVVISMFENAADRDDWVAVGKSFGTVAVGPNWVVGSDSQEVVEEIADELDATIPEAENEEG